jgi:hypothetical protein
MDPLIVNANDLSAAGQLQQQANAQVALALSSASHSSGGGTSALNSVATLNDARLAAVLSQNMPRQLLDRAPQTMPAGPAGANQHHPVAGNSGLDVIVSMLPAAGVVFVTLSFSHVMFSTTLRLHRISVSVDENVDR